MNSQLPPCIHSLEYWKWSQMEITRQAEENEELRMRAEQWHTANDQQIEVTGPLRDEIRTLRAEIERLKAENERLRALLAECFPLVRSGTDLSKRMRQELSQR